jgi:hypothetical protein
MEDCTFEEIQPSTCIDILIGMFSFNLLPIQLSKSLLSFSVSSLLLMSHQENTNLLIYLTLLRVYAIGRLRLLSQSKLIRRFVSLDFSFEPNV